MLAEGVQARVIMQTLGHSQISITLNTYGHVSADLSRDAADRMESLMGRADDALAAKMAAAREQEMTLRPGSSLMIMLLTRPNAGAASGNRTPDLRITSALLCHLS